MIIGGDGVSGNDSDGDGKGNDSDGGDNSSCSSMFHVVKNCQIERTLRKEV